MRRIALGAAVICAVVVAGLVLLSGRAAGGGDPYDVYAIFDNASFVAQGEDVRIAGATVGSVTGTSVCVAHSATSCRPGTRNRAAITLEIDNSAFTPFRANATCALRLQSLIGEKYVDCTPGTSNYPALTRIRNGPGAGSYLLPVTRTTSPVDFDIVQNISRQSLRQQFTLILNELGTGLAARGSDLNAVIHRADPALGYTDQVLKILAAQNRQLAQLATDSRAVLVPLARDRHQIADFVVQANTTSVASAARAADIARSFQLLPTFLRRLRPLMADLGALADQATPVFSALSQAAPSINKQYELLAPFAKEARTSLINLGASAAQQQPALLASIPLAKSLEKLGGAIVSPATSLDRLTSSLESTGGIQQLMALLFHGTGAINGFDSAGHYIRTESLVGDCTGYAIKSVLGCSANFGQPKAEGDTGTGTSSRAQSKIARIVRAARAGATPRWSTSTIAPLLHYLIGGGR